MKSLPLIALTLLLGACAGTQNLAVSPTTLDNMQGKSLTLVQNESPSFVAMTSGKGMFAVAGVGAAVADGNKMVKESGIVDPAATISRGLAENLVNNYGMNLADESVAASSDDVDAIVALAVGSDYALDVVTNGWSYMYDGFKFDDYFVGYSSKLRLIDVRAGQVVASGLCAYDAKKAGKAPVTRETLIADNSAYIKKELADATDICIRDFSANIFSTASASVAQHTP